MSSSAATTHAHHAPLSLAGLRRELPPLLRLAGPVVMAELGGMLMGLVDVMMVGRVGAEAIGAVSVGANLFHFVSMFGIGILLGLDYLIAHAYGGGRLHETHRTLVQSLYLCLVMAALLSVLLWLAHRYLDLLGIEASVLPDARAYLGTVSFGLLPFLWFVALRRYLQAVGLVRAATFALISANLVNLFVNWVLIFGNLGAPALGAAGAAWATTASRVYMLAVLVGFTVWHARRNDPALFRVALAPDPALLARIVKLGLPASVQVVLEGGVFTAATLLAAGLDPLSLAAHQIALGAAAFSFMVPLGVASAGAVRVGQALGAGDPRAAERSGWAALADRLRLHDVRRRRVHLRPAAGDARLHRRRGRDRHRHLAAADRRRVPALRRPAGGRGRHPARQRRDPRRDDRGPGRLLGDRPAGRLWPVLRGPDGGAGPLDRALGRPHRGRHRARRLVDAPHRLVAASATQPASPGILNPGSGPCAAAPSVKAATSAPAVAGETRPAPSSSQHRTSLARPLRDVGVEMPVPIHTTMLELVAYLSTVTETDREVVARVTELVNGGVVVLRGNFAGHRIPTPEHAGLSAADRAHRPRPARWPVILSPARSG